MEFNKTETQSVTKQVVNHAYPPIIVAGAFASGNEVIGAGTPLALDASDEYVPYEEGGAGSLGKVVGVSTKDVNTDAEGGAVGAVLRLGLVHKDALTDSSTATLKALAAEKIFAS